MRLYFSTYSTTTTSKRGGFPGARAAEGGLSLPNLYTIKCNPARVTLSDRGHDGSIAGAQT